MEILMNLNSQKKIKNKLSERFLKLADVNSCSPKLHLKGEDKEYL